MRNAPRAARWANSRPRSACPFPSSDAPFGAQPEAQPPPEPTVPQEPPPQTPDEPLVPGEPLAPGPVPHRSRYAGTVLITAAIEHLGLSVAMERATVRRPETAVYSAQQALVALSAAWASGLPSLEAMHERDARSLGVVLGLERSPSVRTLWRAIVQLRAGYDPVQWWAGWITGLLRVNVPEMQENGIKAVRAFVPVDHLDDRGAVGYRADDRPVRNPARAELLALLRELERVERTLGRERPQRGEQSAREIAADRDVNALHQGVLCKELSKTPATVPRVQVEPAAQRAELQVRNRQLLLPLKNATENSRRWLLCELGAGLSPSDEAWDQETRARTLEALVRAPGWLRLKEATVEVMIELPLPPQPHARLDEALRRLDGRLRFVDGRAVTFRLAPRPTRAEVLLNPPGGAG